MVPRRSHLAAFWLLAALSLDARATAQERADAALPLDAGLDGGPDAGLGAIGAEPADAALAEPLASGAPLEEPAPPPSPTSLSLTHLPSLPPVRTEPEIAPLIEGRPQRETTPAALPATERRGVVIKTILGLLGLLALAYVAGHPRVQRWERAIGISQVITAGFPFVILGMIARLPGVDILSDSMLAELSPVLRIGLGWIGFVVGFRFDTRVFSGLPEGTARVIGLTTSIPFVFVAGATGLLLLAFSDGISSAALRDPVFVRDALIFGTAGAMTATSAARLFGPSRSEGMLYRIARLEELAGVFGLAMIAAYFRPQGAYVTWQLPGTAWFFVTLGLGVTIGALVYAILLRTHDGPEFVVVTLGSISFAAGAAGYLRLSPVVVAFVAALLLANFPGAYKDRLGATLRRLERPVYLMSLVAIGALWRIDDFRGWVLMPVFMGMRLWGKWLATRISERQGDLNLEPHERDGLAIAPIGPLAIAIVVNAQMLYPGGSVSLVVSGVIGGAILTEIAVQWMSRRTRAREHLASALGSVHVGPEKALGLDPEVER